MEVKCKDTYWQTAPVLPTGSWQSLNALSQGYTARTRIGNVVRIRRIQYRAQVLWADAHTGVSVSRVMLFLDTQGNGSMPAHQDFQNQRLLFHSVF